LMFVCCGCIFGDSPIACGKCLVCSIKGKVKKKHFSRGWNFSTFAAHLIEQDLF